MHALQLAHNSVFITLEYVEILLKLQTVISLHNGGKVLYHKDVEVVEGNGSDAIMFSIPSFESCFIVFLNLLLTK